MKGFTYVLHGPLSCVLSVLCHPLVQHEPFIGNDTSRITLLLRFIQEGDNPPPNGSLALSTIIAIVVVPVIAITFILLLCWLWRWSPFPQPVEHPATSPVSSRVITNQALSLQKQDIARLANSLQASI